MNSDREWQRGYIQDWLDRTMAAVGSDGSTLAGLIQALGHDRIAVSCTDALIQVGLLKRFKIGDVDYFVRARPQS